MARPLDGLFGITVSYNEILERWVAINNRDQEVIGYGMTSMEALSDYFRQSVEKDEKSKGENEL